MAKRRSITLKTGAKRIADEDAPIIRELRARWDYARQAWDPIIEEGRIDTQYVMGNTWDENDRKMRVGRLMLSFDQLNQYLNQLVNTVLQQKRAIKITPEGNGANDQTAELRANRIRQIEYLSHGQEVYTTAFRNMCERSYGYARIVAEKKPKSFKKHLRLKAIPNPDQVLPDPDAMSITGADWKYLFYDYDMSREEFNRDFPDAEFKEYTDIHAEDMLGASEWQGVDRVKVAEYWTVKIEQRRFLRVGTSATEFVELYEKDLKPSQKGAITQGRLKILAEQMDEVPVVCMYLTNGMELLAMKGQPKKTEWKGSRIPFKACYGKIIYTNDDGKSAIASSKASAKGMPKKVILSFVRLARSAAKYYNWLKSTEGEVISMFPRTPYMAYAGSLTPEQLIALQSSVHTPVPVIMVNAWSEKTGDTILPFPRREAPEPPIQAYEMAAEAARRDIQNALGRYSASVGRADTNVKSGVALKQLDQQSDQGSYHFINAYDALICALGEDLEELLEFYDDTAEEISTRTAGGEVRMQPVNGMIDPKTNQPSPMMSDGTHATTVSTGPSFDSERMEASAFADLLVGNAEIARVLGPQKSQALMSLAVKLKNIGPIGDEMADIINPKQDDDPRALQQHLQQAMQQLQQQSGVLQKMHEEIQSKQTEARNKLDIEKERGEYDLKKAQSDNDARVKIAEIQAGATLGAADIKADLTHSIELMSTQLSAIQGLVDSNESQRDRMHELMMAVEQRGHEKEMAATGQEQALEQGAAGVEGQMAVQDNAPVPAQGEA